MRLNNPSFFNTPIYRVAIVGPGAVGGFLAKQFVEAGAQVSLIGRDNSENLSHLLKDGLVIETADHVKN